MNKFKIGDVVEILNNNQGYSEDFTGQVTEIIEVFGDYVEGGGVYNVRVQYEAGFYNNLSFNEKNLKLARSAGVEESQEEIELENVSAADILQQAKDCLVNRASERDKEQERSMKSCVEAFNALTGKSLTETEGWIFMTVLKLARSQGGNFKLDDYVDMAAYAALAGESGGK